MRTRVFATRVAVAGAMMTASTVVVAPPAQALVCRRVPDQCEAVLDELRKHPLVCESIPAFGDPDGNTTAFCENPDGWAIGPVQTVGYRVIETIEPIRDIVDDAPERVRDLVCAIQNVSCDA